MTVHAGRPDVSFPPVPPGPPAARTGRRRGTLPLRVEVRRQLHRRRTQLTMGFLVLLPWLLVLAFKIGSGPRDRSQAPALVDLATGGALNFTVFTVFAATGFLYVVVVALFAGDTVAAEASWSSLRYLLVIPVRRSRLLARKLVVALGYSLAALLLLPLVALLAGWVSFGWAPLRTPLGDTLGTWAALGRLAVVVGYLAVSLLFVAALAFLLGAWTDAPLGAVGGAVLLVIVSNILDAIPALGSLRQGLPTHYQYAWADALAPTIAWGQMARGALWSIGLSAVLLALAWRHFLRKDVLS